MTNGPLEFVCPRCEQPATAAYYGPCEACLTELKTMYGQTDVGEVHVPEYVPKMNVTPNAVATKD